MILQIALVAAVSVLGVAVTADYSGERYRPSSYATPSPDSAPYHPEAAESKSYADDDRPRYDGPSQARTGPHRTLGPIGFGGGPLPLSYGHPQRLLPHGSVIGYLAYPQPLLHGGYPAGYQGGYSPLGLHDPAFSSPLAFAPPSPLAYPHLQLQHQPPSRPGYTGQQQGAAAAQSGLSQQNYSS